MIVNTQSLTKRYGTKLALNDCNLTIPQGEVFGLLGPNGSGKTTLLRLLLGYLRPTSGSARIDGLDCYRDSLKVHRRIGFLPADARLYGRMRGHQVLRLFAGLRQETDFQAALTLAERLELDIKCTVAAMSSGMRQKLALAVTLSKDVPLFLLDEPSSMLDPNMRILLQTLVREARERGKTVIFSSHVIDEVERTCDRVGILQAGRLVCLQKMSELRVHHRIRAELASDLPPLPAPLTDEVHVTTSGKHVTIETKANLTRLLSWLSTLPVEELQIEPYGLRSVYERYHRADDA